MQKKWKLFLCLLLFAAAGQAQNLQITRFEYYFDTDPGIGNGTLLTVSPTDSLNLTTSIMVPSTLSQGYHWLYVRSYFDSAGTPRSWSLTEAVPFYAPDSLVYAEYFFDTDPGQGSGTALSAGNTSDSLNQTYSIPTPALLTAGTHNLYVRTRSQSGRWSLAEPVDFYTPGALANGEYFFDTDPGFGSGTAFTFPAQDSLNTTLAITVPNLAGGVHQLYVRTRSVTGAWGHAYPVDFFVNGAVADGEYFFDTDPGVGNGISFAFTPGDSVGQALTASTAALSGGEHRLYVRSRDHSGKWSHVDEAFFYLLPKIVQGEYYWDTDPGVGNGTVLFTGGTSDTINQNFTFNAPCLPPGKHLLSVRTRDDQGKWSLVGYDSLTFANPAMALTATYPGPGPFGTPVKLRASGGRLPYQYQLDNNPVGTDSIVLAPNGNAVVFTATDSCGYMATAALTTPPAPTDLSVDPTGTGMVALTGWDHWVYLLDGSGKIIAAAHDGRQNLGNTAISYKHVEAPDTVRTYSNHGHAPYFDRNWKLSSERNPQQPVGLRLYGTDAELARYMAAEPTVTQVQGLYLTKYNGTNEDLDYGNNDTGGNYSYYAPDSSGAFAGATTSGFHIHYRIPGFSELYLNRDLNVPLSLSKIAVGGTAETGRIRLEWETVSEKDLLRYELMKQAGGDWKLLESVTAQNKSKGLYAAFDNTPLQGKNIYQVRIVEANGTVSYSPSVVVHYIGANAIAIFPNPATESLNVNGLEPGAVLILTDVSGKTIFSRPAAQDNRLTLAGLAGGVYQLIIRQPNGEQLQTSVLKR